MASATFRIWRGERGGGKFVDYTTEFETGMVVLDVVHKIQGTVANDMAVRWNCKAGKCGSCSAEINGKPRLMCMTRLNQLDLSQPVTVEPMKTFPHVRDLVTDVSFDAVVADDGISPKGCDARVVTASGRKYRVKGRVRDTALMGGVGWHAMNGLTEFECGGRIGRPATSRGTPPWDRPHRRRETSWRTDSCCAPVRVRRTCRRRAA